MTDEEWDELYMTDKRAKTIDGWIASLEIFKRHHLKGGEGSNIFEADHDIIWGPLVDVVSQKSPDGIELCKLGWHIDDEHDHWCIFV